MVHLFKSSSTDCDSNGNRKVASTTVQRKEDSVYCLVKGLPCLSVLRRNWSTQRVLSQVILKFQWNVLNMPGCRLCNVKLSLDKMRFDWLNSPGIQSDLSQFMMLNKLTDEKKTNHKQGHCAREFLLCFKQYFLSGAYLAKQATSCSGF